MAQLLLDDHWARFRAGQSADFEWHHHDADAWCRDRAAQDVQGGRGVRVSENVPAQRKEPCQARA